MKGLMFALLCVLLLALATIGAACGDDNGEGAPAISDETSTPEDPGAAETDAAADPSAGDTVEPGELPDEFGRGPEAAFDLAREACGMWEEWNTDDGESALAPIATKADEAREASDVRDSVLERLAGDLGDLLDALKSREGSGVINLTNRLVGEVCKQVG